ncbi:MAG TPA: MFS transporter [Deltaproteobacteria bacterium]|nr:MFS transporter [Deltaproteobacteria bacterium]
MPDEKKTVLSWALYDWANSAFATTVMAGFFPVFFKQYWSAGTDTVVSTARLGLANSLSGMTVAVLAPVLGAIADSSTTKKRFLLLFAFLGVAMTSGLSLVAQGHWRCAVLLYAVATIGFSGGNVFYDSLLPAVASTGRMDQVSALGYALGYLGGGLLFALNVAMTLHPHAFGLADSGQAVRIAFLTVGLWWAFFSVPIMLFVHEPRPSAAQRGKASVRSGIAQLLRTFREISGLKPIFIFLAAYWLYIDGVDTIVRMAVDYGMSIGFKSNDLILALLITQFVGFPAAIAFGWLGGKVGAKRGIYLAIGVYIGIAVWGAFMHKPGEFYALAVTIGLVQGGIQALSRSFYARLIPADKAAEFFGFYNMLGKFAVVIGPALMAGFGLVARGMGLPASVAARVGISSVALLFILGAVLLTFVDESGAGGKIDERAADHRP